MSDADYANANAESLERLRTLIDRLTDEDLQRPIEGGWTVAATLAHLAFWDRRHRFSLERWQRTGEEPAVPDADAVNDALLPIALALDPALTGALALDAGAAVDDAVARLPAGFAATVVRAGYPYLLRRSQHRLNHIDQIARAFER